MQFISPDTLNKRRHYLGIGSKQTAILVYMRVREEGCNKGVSVKEEELDFISLVEAITWGFFWQVEHGLFPSNFFFAEHCAWQITFATESSLFRFSFSFIVALSFSYKISYCLQEIDAFPGVQIVSLLWTSGDKKLRSRVSNEFCIYAHWSCGLSIRQWSGRPGFNPRSHHTKDFKNGTWYLLD